MVLPKNNLKLIEIFKNAEAPEINEFAGEYAVDMLTRLPSLKIFFHHKKFYAQGGRLAGENIFLKNFVWGYFWLEQGKCEDMGSLPSIKINYNAVNNSFISKPMRDFVRRIEKGKLYLGRLYFKIGKRLIFLGFFSLEKIK